MITALIFAAHIVFIIVVFTKKWQNNSMSDALQNVVFIIILFSVGWPLLTMVLKVFIEQEGLGKNFDRDTIVLTILSIIEFFFYKFYYAELFISSTDKEK